MHDFNATLVSTATVSRVHSLAVLFHFSYLWSSLISAMVRTGRYVTRSWVRDLIPCLACWRSIAFMNEMIGSAINEMIGPVIVFYHDNTKFYQWEKYRPVGYTLCNVNSNCISICMVLKTDHCQFSFNLPMIFRTPPFPRPSHMPLVMSTPPEVARHATGIRSLLPTRLTGEAYRALLIKMFSFI
jgi:hypothetical protein